MSEPTIELDQRFSSPEATPRPWAEVDGVLAAARMFWIATVRRTGAPHVTPLHAVWHDGGLYFCTGATEQKAKNLAAEPRCTLTTGTDDADSGLDVVLEGRAARVTDESTLLRLAQLWKERLDWDFGVRDGGFDNGEGTTALVFGVAPDKVLAFGKGESFSQTRYRFPA
ncbi:pyridoxamine 5'-phosphate oxidase family protein [Nocardia sp. bgisy134]|uniref:pyridoxamine 5'-phosphate oxidase family protein n=1 Tax=Nocardia sp. bgisy134 TaxID=3413789 RepID=UPI003D74AAE2